MSIKVCFFSINNKAKRKIKERNKDGATTLHLWDSSSSPGLSLTTSKQKTGNKNKQKKKIKSKICRPNHKNLYRALRIPLRELCLALNKKGMAYISMYPKALFKRGCILSIFIITIMILYNSKVK